MPIVKMTYGLDLDDIKIGNFFKASSLKDVCLYPPKYWDSLGGLEFEFGYDVVDPNSQEIILVIDIKQADIPLYYRLIKILFNGKIYIIFVRDYGKEQRGKIFWEKVE